MKSEREENSSRVGKSTENFHKPTAEVGRKESLKL